MTRCFYIRSGLFLVRMPKQKRTLGTGLNKAIYGLLRYDRSQVFQLLTAATSSES